VIARSANARVVGDAGAGGGQVGTSTGDSLPPAPRCPVCQRSLLGADGAFGLNHCRSFAIVDLLHESAGLTAWEVAKSLRLPFDATSRGLLKAREHRAVIIDWYEPSEPSPGVRYMYRAVGDWPEQREEWAARHLETLRSVAGG
jgi:hypothetical protein